MKKINSNIKKKNKRETTFHFFEVKKEKIILYLTSKRLKELGEILYRLTTREGDKIELTISSVNGKRYLEIFIIPEELKWEEMQDFIKKHQK